MFGAWMVIAPHVLSGGNTAAWWNDMAVGLAVMTLSLRRGRIQERFGGWDRWVI